MTEIEATSQRLANAVWARFKGSTSGTRKEGRKIANKRDFIFSTSVWKVWNVRPQLTPGQAPHPGSVKVRVSRVPLGDDVIAPVFGLINSFILKTGPVAVNDRGGEKEHFWGKRRSRYLKMYVQFVFILNLLIGPTFKSTSACLSNEVLWSIYVTLFKTFITKIRKTLNFWPFSIEQLELQNHNICICFLNILSMFDSYDSSGERKNN